MSCLSKSGVQFAPPSSVFQTPPATAPKYQVFGSPGTPSMARARPPRNGPTCRHCIPEKSFGSICGAGVGDALGGGAGAAPTAPVNATRKAKKKRRPREFMARKLQTYAHRSTTNVAREHRGYNFLYVEFPMFAARKLRALRLICRSAGGNKHFGRS